MAHCNGASGTFDTLPPEILDCILPLAAADQPCMLDKLAMVNTSFREAALRCNKTLILRKAKKPGKRTSPLAADALAALVMELELRPALCNLVIGREANASLWKPALTTIQWTSAKVILSLGNGVIADLFQMLSGAKSTLELLDVDLGRWHPPSLVSTILNITRAFPILKTLRINGGKAGIDSTFEKYQLGGHSVGACDLSSAVGSLTHLDIVSYKFRDWSEAMYKILPTGLTTLTSLRFQCTSRKQMGVSLGITAAKAALSRLRNLDIDLWGNSVRHSMLKAIADHCPQLQKLVIHVAPLSRTDYCGTPKEGYGFQSFSYVLDHCPELELLAISEGTVLPLFHLVSLLRDRGLVPLELLETALTPKCLEKALAEKIHIIGKHYHPAELKLTGERLCTETEVIDSCLMVGMSASRWDRRGDPALIQERMLGERDSVQHWLRVFC